MRDRSEGWLYFIREEGNGGAVKIGFANDVEERLKQLQTGNPRRLRVVLRFRGCSELEAALHRIHAKRRIIGEWFECDEDMEKAIEGLRYYEENDALLQANIASHRQWLSTQSAEVQASSAASGAALWKREVLGAGRRRRR